MIVRAMSLPQRKSLSHHVPLWVRAADAVYFLTICCEPRGQNQLAREAVAAAIFETVAFRNANHVWYAHLFLLMPDHAHALVSFPPDGRLITKVVSQWKEWTAKQAGVVWQRDFFEHRLRREESLRDKSDYILHNPVRAGLVARAEDWPYVWFPSE